MDRLLESLLAGARAIDGMNRRLGKGVGWLTLVMVLVGAYNALARYLDRFLVPKLGWGLSSNAYIELQWYLFSLVFLLAASYTFSKDAHVRVDVLYGRLSARGKAWIDLIGGVLFLLPFTIFCLVMSWPAVRNSWAVWEISPDPSGLPRYPIKSFILVAFGLLFLQGVARTIQLAAELRGVEEKGR